MYGGIILNNFTVSITSEDNSDLQVHPFVPEAQVTSSEM